MPELTEETALNLLEAVLMLNANIEALTKKIDNTPTPTPPPTEEPKRPPQEKQKDVVMSMGPLIPRKDGAMKPSYIFVGGSEYDITKSSKPPEPSPTPEVVETPETKDCEHNWEPVDGTNKIMCSKCLEEQEITPLPQEEVKPEPDPKPDPEPPKKIKGEGRTRGLAKKIKDQIMSVEQKD